MGFKFSFLKYDQRQFPMALKIVLTGLLLLASLVLVNALLASRLTERMDLNDIANATHALRALPYYLFAILFFSNSFVIIILILMLRRKQLSRFKPLVTAETKDSLSRDLERKKDVLFKEYTLDQHSIVAIADDRGNITYANEKFIQLTGYSADELIGKHHRQVINEKRKDDLLQEMYATLHRGQVWHDDIRNRSKLGNEYWITITITPIKDRAGKIAHYFAICTDVTHQHFQQKEIARHRMMIDTMGSHARLGAWEVDLEKNEVIWSTVTKQIHEVSADFQPTIQSVYKFFKPGESKETMSQTIDLARKEGKAFSVECQIITDKGNELWIHVIGQTEFQDGVCTRIMGAIQDIQERKEFELDLVRAKELAEAAVLAKSNFLANMSHEIRTPLNGVIGMIELVNQSTLSHQQSHYLNVARSSADSLLSIINDILDFSKIEAGKMELESIDFNYIRMLEDLVDSMQVLTQAKNIQLTLDSRALTNHFLRGDPTRIRQILTNLVSNAIKFTQKGHVLIRSDLKHIDRESAQLTIEVIDTGVGIENDKIESLFEPFAQEDASTTRNFGGTGLGLSIVKSLVDFMKGTISVDSRIGQGSHFTVTLPVTQSSLILKQIPNPDLAKFNALIITEHAQQNSDLVRQLTDLGLNIQLITTDVDVRVLANMHLNFVLCQLASPRASAQSLIDKLHNHRCFKGSKWILITPNSQQGDGQIFADMGFHAYVSLPTNSQELKDMLSVLASPSPSNTSTATSLVTRHMVSEIRSAGQTKYDQLTWPEHLNILLVEDNQTNTLVAKGILKSLGLQCDIAHNGQEAVDKIKQPTSKPYTLVFMDCQMPIMDGFEATLAIREFEQTKPEQPVTVIIAMTANAMSGDKEACLTVGMDDYIAKPINRDGLMHKIQNYFPQ